MQQNVKSSNESTKKVKKGKILHVDGDKKYSRKSFNFYEKLGLNFVVKNIPEYKQPHFINELLIYYKPDILVITGHDSMHKKNKEFNNINNYKNSKYFIEAVKIARRYQTREELAIFAGACQSYYEGLITARSKFCIIPWKNFNRFYRSINCSK